MSRPTPCAEPLRSPLRAETLYLFRHTASLTAAALTADAGQLALGASDGIVVVLDATGSPRYQRPLRRSVAALRWAGGGDALWVLTADGQVTCLGADGALRWTEWVGAEVDLVSVDGVNAVRP